MQFIGSTIPFVISGSLFKHCALLRGLFTELVQAALPEALIVHSTREATLGAAMMVLYEIGHTIPPLMTPAQSTATRARRANERRHPLTMQIGSRPTLELMHRMNLEDQRVPRLIATQLPQIASLIDAIAERFASGGRLIFAGAGTSGRLGVLDAAECRPTFSTTLDQVFGIIAGGETAMLHSIEGAEDDEEQGRRELVQREVRQFDSVIGIAASGGTPFVKGILREATERGALTGCVVNAANAPIAALVQHPILVPTGPEVLTGSTRLKAGTAQKLVLNMISTGVMVRVGRTFDNLMTDVQASNIKLHERAKTIVSDATGLPLQAAGDLLQHCRGEIKTAIASALLSLPPDEARARVAALGGNVFRAVQSGAPSGTA